MFSGDKIPFKVKYVIDSVERKIKIIFDFYLLNKFRVTFSTVHQQKKNNLNSVKFHEQFETPSAVKRDV